MTAALRRLFLVAFGAATVPAVPVRAVVVGCSLQASFSLVALIVRG